MRTLLTKMFRGPRPQLELRRPPMNLVTLEGREVPAMFSFAGVSFDTDNAPSTFDKTAVGTYNGAVVNTEPSSTTVAPVAFPDQVGFPPNLAIGSNIFGKTDVRPLNLPAGDVGAINRSGVTINYQGGRAIANAAGDDIVFYESASSGTAIEAYMIQAYNVNQGTWSPWIWQGPDAFSNYVGDPIQGAFVTSYDLSDFGFAAGEYATKFRIVNMMPQDRMANASGQGIVVPESNTGTNFPSTGPNFGNLPLTANSDFDPDPLYFGALGDANVNIANIKTTVVAVPNPGTSGTEVTYTVTITNLGSGFATGVEPDFMLDPDFTVTSTTSMASGGASGNTNTPNNDTLSLPESGTVVYTIVGTVAGNAPSPLVSTFDGGLPALPVVDPNLADNKATSSLPLTTSGQLNIVVTPASGNAPAGAPITYTVTVTNPGPSTVTGGTVATIIDPNLLNPTYTSTATNATGNTPSGNGNIGDTVTVQTGGSITYTVTGTLSPTASGNVPFVVNTTANGSGPNQSVTVNTNAVPTGDLSVEMTATPTAPIAGSVVTYTITAANSGPSTATGALLTDFFNSAFTNTMFTSVAFGGATGNSNGVGDINQALVLPTGSKVVYTVQATLAPNDVGPVTNTATLTAPNGFVDPDPSNNSKSVQIQVIPGADIGLTVTPNTPVVSVGATMSYNVEIVNNGPSAVTGVQVQSLLDSNILNPTFTSVASNGATGNTTVGSGNYNDFLTIPQGGKVVYTISGQVATGIIGTNLNSTFTTKNPVSVPDPGGDNSVTITTPVQASPNVIYVASTGLGVVTQVFVFNADGSQRFSYQPYATAFTRGVWSAVGDVNGDGFPDVVTGAAAGGGSHVKAVNGLDGSNLFSFFAFGSTVRTGVVVTVADTNGDGIGEIICGSDVGGGPRVRVFDVTQGTPGDKSISDFFAFDPTMNKGVRVASGNTTGSKVFEVIVSAGPGGPSNVNIFNSVTGQQVQTFQPFGTSTRGIYVAAADFNDDGIVEIVCGDDRGSTPTVGIYDPAQNFALTSSFLAYESNFRGGVRVATYADDSVSIANPPNRILTGPGPGGGPRLRKFTGTGGDLGSQFLIGSFDRGGIYVG